MDALVLACSGQMELKEYTGGSLVFGHPHADAKPPACFVLLLHPIHLGSTEYIQLKAPIRRLSSCAS